MNEDPRLRARLKELSDHEALPELDALARARVERAALAKLAAARGRARYVRGGAWAAAAALLIWVGVRSSSQRTSDSHDQRADAPRSSPRIAAPGGAPAVASPALAGACAENGRWSATQRGRSQLDLHERALLVASADARVSGGLSATCDTEITLAAGTVAVHARRLGGRALTVRTARGVVSVKGTIFSIGLSADARQLLVQVDEGVVAVSAPGVATDVLAGQALALRSDGPHASPWSLTTRNQLRALLGLAPRAEPRERADAGEPALEPPAQARVWQSGALPPPSIPPEPGSSITEEGRPLAKPRLIEGGTPP